MFEYWMPKIGQRVKLNRKGFSSLRLDSEEAFAQAMNMQVMALENMGTEREPIWAVEVDQPLINCYMLDSSMLTPLP